MRLSMHTDYALRLLISLGSREGDVVSVTEIADIFSISRHHLIRVAQRLRDADYVETVRGNGGGVRLAQAPSAINIGAVVRCTESDFALVACFVPGGVCRILPGCRLRGVLGEAMAAFLAVLDRYYLEDLLVSRPLLRELLGVNDTASTNIRMVSLPPAPPDPLRAPNKTNR